MQFLIIAHDGADEGALARRLAAREQHLAVSTAAVKTGEQIVAAAMLDDDGKMHGSVMIVDFPSRKELDEWLKREPYVTGHVWKKVEIHQCKIGPSFGHVLKK